MSKDRKLYVFPGNIEDDILKLSSEQIPYMRTDEFSRLYTRISKEFTTLTDCHNGKTIVYTMSGTGAMETALLSFGRGKNIVSINAGSFGARWKEIADYHDIALTEFVLERNEEKYITDLNEIIESENVDVLFMQHHETSTGELLDIEKIGHICNSKNIIFVVDSISSFLSDEISMDRMNIDVLINSSQKSLNIPPGLAMITLSRKAQNIANKSSFYTDVESQISNSDRGQTPYSPSTQIFIQLDHRIREIKKSGILEYREKIKEKSKFFRSLCQSHGLKINSSRKSNSMTAIQFDYPVTGLVNYLMEKNIFVMPGGDNLIRVTHTGVQSEKDLIELMGLIKKYIEEREYVKK